MIPVPPARHFLRAKDLIDARYREQLDVPALARAARLSTAHFSREFRRSFGETPHQYLLTLAFSPPASWGANAPDAHWRVKRRQAAADVVIAATADPIRVTAPCPWTCSADPRALDRGTGQSKLDSRTCSSGAAPKQTVG
jgi:AraC-like DNA-binding protein